MDTPGRCTRHPHLTEARAQRCFAKQARQKCKRLGLRAPPTPPMPPRPCWVRRGPIPVLLFHWAGAVAY